MTQTKTDSLIETSANIIVGFSVAWGVQLFIIAPIWNIDGGAGGAFIITCIFTVASFIRQYILRRLFNGRSVGQALIDALNRKNPRRLS